MFGKLTEKFSTIVQKHNHKKSLKKLLHFVAKYNKLNLANNKQKR